MESSTRNTKRRVQFRLTAPSGSEVFVAGTFNRWEPKATPLKESAGNYSVMVMLLPGRYEYKFIVNGDWMTDPKGRETVPNDRGSRNSVIVI
jgi:1,4-alpha-glucan branching enzyme